MAMSRPTEDDALIRVGDLARDTGLTVRTLHHYEAVGLLQPSARTDSGHRLYGPAEIERLYRVATLRRLRLSLAEIRTALDDPDWSLTDSLRTHLDSIDEEIDQLRRTRDAVRAALSGLEADDDPTTGLLAAINALHATTPPLRRRISILVYRDLPAVYDQLVQVFGLVPGEVTTDDEGRTVHAEVFAGDGVIWLHPESPEYQLASPAALGSATATMAVLVDDVDAHYQATRERGGNALYGPVDQPYDYREYGIRDLEGTLWSFMKELTHD